MSTSAGKMSPAASGEHAVRWSAEALYRALEADGVASASEPNAVGPGGNAASRSSSNGCSPAPRSESDDTQEAAATRTRHHRDANESGGSFFFFPEESAASASTRRDQSWRGDDRQILGDVSSFAARVNGVHSLLDELDDIAIPLGPRRYGEFVTNLSSRTALEDDCNVVQSLAEQLTINDTYLHEADRRFRERLKTNKERLAEAERAAEDGDGASRSPPMASPHYKSAAEKLKRVASNSNSPKYIRSRSPGAAEMPSATARFEFLYNRFLEQNEDVSPSGGNRNPGGGGESEKAYVCSAQLKVHEKCLEAAMRTLGQVVNDRVRALSRPKSPKSPVAGPSSAGETTGGGQPVYSGGTTPTPSPVAAAGFYSALMNAEQQKSDLTAEVRLIRAKLLKSMQSGVVSPLGASPTLSSGLGVSPRAPSYGSAPGTTGVSVSASPFSPPPDAFLSLDLKTILVPAPEIGSEAVVGKAEDFEKTEAPIKRQQQQLEEVVRPIVLELLAKSAKENASQEKASGVLDVLSRRLEEVVGSDGKKNEERDGKTDAEGPAGSPSPGAARGGDEEGGDDDGHSPATPFSKKGESKSNAASPAEQKGLLHILGLDGAFGRSPEGDDGPSPSQKLLGDKYDTVSMTDLVSSASKSPPQPPPDIFPSSAARLIEVHLAGHPGGNTFPESSSSSSEASRSDIPVEYMDLEELSRGPRYGPWFGLPTLKYRQMEKIFRRKKHSSPGASKNPGAQEKTRE